MAAGGWKTYDKAQLNKLNGEMPLSLTTNWKMALFLSTSNCDTLTAHEVYGDLTNEHANANGYTTGGVALTNVVLSRTGNVVTLDCDNPVWTASGGSIIARHAVIYQNSTPLTKIKPLYVTCLLEAIGPADVTATNGNTLTITINASGITTDTGDSTN